MELTIFDRFKIRRVTQFTEFNLDLEYDKLGSSFSFSFYFEPDNPEHKELACVSHYHTCEISHEGETLVKGFAVSQSFYGEPAKRLCKISGYSLPGILEDSSIPPSLFPLQSDGVSLKTIAEKLTNPWKTKYGLGVVIDPSVADIVSKPFKKSTAGENSTVGAYLVSLAQQKDIILSHDEKGNLLLTMAKTDGEPIVEFDYRNGEIPGTSFDMTFSGQGIHSHIYVQRQASVSGGNAGYHTIKNPYCPIVFRPKVVSQSSGDDNDTEKVARRELAKELENITLTIETDRWIIKGKVVRPNNVLTIIDPELYIYVKSKWFIRSVSLRGDASKTTATWNCVPPETVNGKYPVSIFAGINMHP